MIEVVISIAFVVCLIALVVGCLDCLFKKKRFEALGIRESTRARQNAAFSVDIFDAASGADPVIIEPLPDILSKVSPVPVLRPRITYTERGKQEAAFSLHNVQRSFPRGHLTYLNEISTGWFGKVIDSEAVHIVGGTDRSHVIVKMLKDDASKLEQKQFMEEVLAFRCVEHVNVLSLLGQCTETTPYLVILEFATHGNLKHYLVRHKHEVDALVASNRLVHFALNAASGLACLHRHEYVHNDLAARNCLVMADYTLKIGDYGTSDHLFKDEYFNTGSELLPVRWMAPETLTRVNGTWTSQNCSKISDMWSFGILLWEICSLGERPYDILTDESVLQGVVLDRSVLPSNVKTKLPFKVKMSSLMIQCWQEPSQRLNVEQTHHILEQMNKTQTDVQHVDSDFDHKWNHLESNHGRVTIMSSNTDSVSALTANHVLPKPTSPPEKPLLIRDVGSPISASDFVIDFDSSSTSTFKNVDDILAPETSAQSSETCTDYNMTKKAAPLNVSPYKIVLENELTRVPVSADYLVPTRTSSEQTVPVHVSQGASSTCQFFSPQSSPSSVYMTASETHTMSSIEPETVQVFSGSDINESLDSEGISLHNLIGGTLQMSTSHDEARFTNNNNVLSDTASAPNENHLSDHFCSSPAVSDDFTDFQSAVSMTGDSFLKTEIVDDIYEEDGSMLKLEVDSSEKDMAVPTHDSMSALSTSNVFSEGDSERNDFTDFVSLTDQSSDAGIQSLPVNDSCSKVALSLDGADPSHLADSNHLAPELSFSCPEPDAGGYHMNILTKFSDSKSDEAVFLAQENTETNNGTDLCVEHPVTTGVLEQSSIEFGEDFHGRNSILRTELSDQSLCFSQTESSDSALHKEDRRIDMDQGQVNIASNESHSLEPDINSFNPTNLDTINSEENFINYDTNNTEMDSSNHDTVRTGENSRNCANDIALNNGIASKSNSGSADIQDYELEIEEQSLTFGSGLYRCSSINLAEDVPNVSQAEENIEHAGDTGEKYQGDENNSLVDSDTESNSSGSGQEYVLSDPKVPEQPQATSAADASSNQSSSHQTDALSTSPGEFDDYALQVASEIYLSRGLKSPRVFEIPPLETIPEHQPMAAVQEDSNYTPSDTSSMDVRYEDMFGSDSYEWDDFYGDPLIGKDISLQHKPHQPSPSPKELDLSDWSMDIDSDSIASSTSLPSRQQEVLNFSVQSEQCLPSKSDISLDSGKSIHYFTDSELMATNHTQSSGGLRGSGVSSLLSHIQSSKVPSSINIHQNDLYSLTDKYELESDSFSDGLASPSQAIDLVSESPSTSHISSSSLPASFLISSSPLPPPDSEVSEHYEDLVVSKCFEPSKDSNWSNTAEKPEIFNEKSKPASNPVDGEIKHDSSILKDSLNNLVPGENIEHQRQPDIVELKLENSTFDIALVHSVDSRVPEEKSDDESRDK